MRHRTRARRRRHSGPLFAQGEKVFSAFILANLDLFGLQTEKIMEGFRQIDDGLLRFSHLLIIDLEPVGKGLFELFEIHPSGIVLSLEIQEVFQEIIAAEEVQGIAVLFEFQIVEGILILFQNLVFEENTIPTAVLRFPVFPVEGIGYFLDPGDDDGIKIIGHFDEDELSYCRRPRYSKT